MFLENLKFLENITAMSETSEQIALMDWTDKSEPTTNNLKQHDEYNHGIFVLHYMMKSVEKVLKFSDTFKKKNTSV